MGRPRKTGKRHPGGKLRQACVVDRGNAFVQARSAAFAVFQGGKAGQQVHDPIGRAWAVGLLDGQAHDAAILRDIGRRYGALYWHEMAALAPRVGEFEPRSRGNPPANDDDPAGEAFDRLDALAKALGHAAYDAMQQLCVNQHWFPDMDPDWMEGLVNEARVKARAGVAGRLAHDCDRRMLALAVSALVAMVDG
jgi:hypothetical protein